MHHLFVDHSTEVHSNTLQCVVVFIYAIFFILWFHKFLTMCVFGVKSHYGDYLFKFFLGCTIMIYTSQNVMYLILSLNFGCRALKL